MAENEGSSVKTGDMVIIRTLEGGEKKTRDVTHRIQETVFKLGDVRDPISGEMVVGPNYRESFWKLLDNTEQLRRTSSTRKLQREGDWRAPETSQINQLTGAGTSLRRKIRTASNHSFQLCPLSEETYEYEPAREYN